MDVFLGMAVVYGAYAWGLNWQESNGRQKSWGIAIVLVAGIVMEGLTSWLVHPLLERLGAVSEGHFESFISGLLLFGACYFLGAMVSGCGFFTGEAEDGKVLRGTRVIDGQRAQAEARKAKARGEPVLTLAGVVVPAKDEVKHFKMIGTTGTGKSTAIRELIRGARAREDRLVIADPDGGYLNTFRSQERGDVVLNPFFSGAARWDFLKEIKSPYDVNQLARSLIPEEETGGGRDWRGYARTFLAAVIEYAYHRQLDLKEVWRLLAVAPSEELKTVVAGTPAQPFLESSNDRMFGSVRSVASSALAGLQFVKAQEQGRILFGARLGAR